MKTIVLTTGLLFLATGALAQSVPGTAPGSASAPTAGSMDPTMTKPKGQIVTVTKPNERRNAGVRAHCSNGTVYWTPKIQEGQYVCASEDAPTPNG